MNGIESFGPTAASLGSGFFIGILIGYAAKKVIKIVAVIGGLFLAGLAYLQYHHIANISWNKLQQVSEGMLPTVANLTIHIPGISSSDGHAAATASSLAMSSFGIPLTGSMSAGLTIGFIKDDNRRWQEEVCISIQENRHRILFFSYRHPCTIDCYIMT